VYHALFNQVNAWYVFSQTQHRISRLYLDLFQYYHNIISRNLESTYFDYELLVTNYITVPMKSFSTA
jgi:hypothetical protein